MIAGYVLGLDIGQVKDHSALAIIAIERGTIDNYRSGRNAELKLVWLEKFELGTNYRAIVERVKFLMNQDELFNRCELIVDRGEVGKAVIEMFTEQKIYPTAIAITAGEEVRRIGGGYSVPKKDLVSSLLVAFLSGRFTFMSTSEGTKQRTYLENLKQELIDFQAKVKQSGHVSYEAESERVHDDLVMATSLATWFANEFGPELLLQQGETMKEWDDLRNGL